MAILAAILIPSITRYINEANEAASRTNARTLYSELSLELAVDSDTLPVVNATDYPDCSFAHSGTGTTADPYVITSVECDDIVFTP